MATDRDRFYERPVGRGSAFMIFHAMEDQRDQEDVRDGLKAFAQAWFATYEDETDLPPAWFKLKELAEDLFVEDFFPEEDEDDE